jgi:hypothetical protein
LPPQSWPTASRLQQLLLPVGVVLPGSLLLQMLLS